MVRMEPGSIVYTYHRPSYILRVVLWKLVVVQIKIYIFLAEVENNLQKNMLNFIRALHVQWKPYSQTSMIVCFYLHVYDNVTIEACLW